MICLFMHKAGNLTLLDLAGTRARSREKGDYDVIISAA